MTYRTGKLLSRVVKSVVTACTPPLRRIVTETISMYLLPYMWYNTSTGMYEHIMGQGGFAPLRKRESQILSVIPICSGGAVVDETSAGRVAQHDH